MNMKKMTRAAAALLMSAMLLTACGGEAVEENAGPVGIAVQVQTVEKQDIFAENRASGRVSADNQATMMVAMAAKCLDVYVQRVYDEPTYSGKDTPANTTKLYMQQLELTSTNTASNGLFKKGRLNLEDGTWSSFADANNGNAQAWQKGKFSLTFPVSAFVSNLAGTLSTNSTDIRNEELEKWGVADTGVNKDEQLLFKAGSIMLIPQSDALTITPSIKYSMVTRGDEGDLIYSPLVDAAGNHYSRLLNDVTGNAISIKLEPAKRYKLVIRIGVEHVEFVVASVEDWDFPIRVNPSTSGSGEEQISHTLNED
jgi:hypothetical protein